ncbi:cell wall hydrolase [Sphingomicrobium sediminis]|uniref:Cell wall hydrolase n=1 Tax=Sphingomicrobium sediminis TaxID=2950949 RepID=A0A9X2EMT9_9SPHN|nr:cell wall hydrolase [Sphingomicrobium sediminis]MCM8558092.1 cell wall hydrolase [Sphingomicrobium sediminis]
MKKSIAVAAFATAVTITSSVAPARDANGTTLTATAASTSFPVAGLPSVAMPATEALLDTVDPVTGEVVAVLPEPEPEIMLAEIEVEPEPVLPEDLGDLVDHFAGTQPRDNEMDCLARAIYFETRGEPLHGQLAVGEVIRNRAESSRFPDSYCSVIKQRRQFSFVQAGRIPEPRRGTRAWKNAVAIARIVDGEHHSTRMDGALFFHANYVNPRWRLKRMGSIGNHIFYQ